jgi:hypothetical protein
LADRVADLATIGAELVPFLAQVDLRVDPAYAGLAPIRPSAEQAWMTAAARALARPDDG